MAGPAKRKPTGNPNASVFKRLKAKVGKKALKPANETDTSFKAASLYVSSQGPVSQSADTVLSAKGKSLAELSLQLQHPAAAVRVSSMKGLSFVIKNLRRDAWQPHLHLLLTSSSKALVDEDDDVRKAGCYLLKEILSRTTVALVSPFLSLIVAYTSSALHGLDPLMRQDGAEAIKILSVAFPSKLNSSLPLLLPQLATILSDRKGNKHVMATLDGIVALLQSSLGATTSKNQSAEEETTENFTYMSGGRSRNAFLFQSSKDSTRIIKPFGSLAEWASDLQDPAKSANNAQAASSAPLPPEALTKLKHGLRDLLVEKVENGDAIQQQINLTMQMAETLIRAIRLTWKLPCAEVDVEESSQRDKKDSITVQVAKLLMEWFPLTVDVLSSTRHDDVLALNGLLSSTVLELLVLSDSQAAKEESSRIIDVLLSYWIKGIQKNQENMISSSQEFLQLLLSPSIAAQSTSIPTKQQRAVVLTALHSKFFQQPNKTTACSMAGRMTATTLVRELQESSQTSFQMEGFVVFLEAWGADYPYESSLVLESLRQRVSAMDAKDPALERLREGLTTLVVSETSTSSVFDSYTPDLQEALLGLIRFLESPSREMLQGLGRFCAKSKDQDTCKLICNVVVAVRKSMRLTDFLYFIITSLGVPASDAPLTNEKLMELDNRVARALPLFRYIGYTRSFQMLHPQFKSWLKAEPDKPNLFLVRSRVACSLLCLMGMEESSDLGDVNISKAPSKEWDTLCPIICEAVQQGLCILAKQSMDTEDRLILPYSGLRRIFSSIRAEVQLERMVDVNTSQAERQRLEQFLRIA